MVEKLWVIDVRDLAKDHDTEKRLSLPVEWTEMNFFISQSDNTYLKELS
jgi:hypothetical protein